MIWILWLLFIIVDVLWNATEERKKWHIYHGLETLYRAIAATILGLIFGLQHADWKIQLMYFLGTATSFWFLFNPGLNWATGKPLNHLGNNITDKIEALVPFEVSLIWKAIAGAGFIYAFYHTDLL